MTPSQENIKKGASKQAFKLCWVGALPLPEYVSFSDSSKFPSTSQSKDSSRHSPQLAGRRALPLHNSISIKRFIPPFTATCRPLSFARYSIQENRSKQLDFKSRVLCSSRLDITPIAHVTRRTSMVHVVAPISRRIRTDDASTNYMKDHTLNVR